MDEKFWLRRWKKNEIGFHLSDPHHYLQRFFVSLCALPGDTVFVPLCGKSPDLVWLHERGLNVIGVELSRTAVESFFSENGLSGEWTTVSDLPCCCAEGYKLLCGDFFKLEPPALGGAVAVYDRGSLVALPPNMRTLYAAHLAALLPSGSKVLLISYEFDQTETCGPPFAVPREEVETLFSGAFLIDSLIEEEVLWSHQGLAARGVTKLKEFAALLVRR